VFHPTAVRSTVLFGAVAALAVTVAGAAIVIESASPDTNTLGFVKQVEGSAILSQGAKYVDATSGMKLYDLDRVMVLEDSSAALELADGCVYEVQASQMLTVQAADTCETLAARANAKVDMTQIERNATSQIQPRADDVADAVADAVVAAAAAPAAIAAAAAPAIAAAAAPAIAAAAAPVGAFYAVWGSTGAAFVAGTGAIVTIALLADGSGGDNGFVRPSLSPGATDSGPF
jgi:hypothetical protein